MKQMPIRINDTKVNKNKRIGKENRNYIFFKLWTKAAAQGYEDAIDGLKQLDELGL